MRRDEPSQIEIWSISLIFSSDAGQVAIPNLKANPRVAFFVNGGDIRKYSENKCQNQFAIDKFVECPLIRGLLANKSNLPGLLAALTSKYANRQFTIEMNAQLTEGLFVLLAELNP
ncbi:unnamed protein product [Gongylonema pulchrum]|uniref:Putative_PNPOx domain-containing protein n=1 Tax=Gongylonema pulchrum TaxID=637853 RepID=A0A183EJN3_9BILA|nr:unnamed protein product [Gongylonema pulchrum]